jgi:YndJ-like protein
LNVVKTRTRVLLGAGVFLVTSILRVPHLQHSAWGEALLLFAALVLAPMLLDLVGDSADDAGSARLLSAAQRGQFGAALCLVAAYGLPAGFRATLAALPWACVLLLLAATGVRRVSRRAVRPLGNGCRDAGLIYAAVGAAWLMADRLGLRPLGFDPSIVLLTAVHFHYAGLLLPVLAALALGESGTARDHRFIGAGVIAGVPAVAVGITATQLRLNPYIEVAATLLMAVSGFAVAVLHLRLALQTRRPWMARALWLGAGLSLGAGMSLALLYGVRYFFHPFPWLDVPWMRALHGSLNALGFGFCGVLGWRLVGKNT